MWGHTAEEPTPGLRAGPRPGPRLDKVPAKPPGREDGAFGCSGTGRGQWAGPGASRRFLSVFFVSNEAGLSAEGDAGRNGCGKM